MIHIIAIGNRNIFSSISESIKDAISSIGKESKIIYCSNKYCSNESCTNFCHSDINIFIFGHKVIPDNSRINILMQTEQRECYLSEFEKENYKKWTRILSGFPEISVYKNSVYFPLGYSKYFDTNIKEKEVRDFYFFGSPAGYTSRSDFCRKHNVLYKNLFGVERDRLIMSSRFTLGINLTDKYLFPSLRALLVMCKGKMFLQEQAMGGYGIYKDYVINFTKDNFSDVVEQWRDKNKRDEYAMYVRDELINKHRFEYNFLNSVKDIIL